MGLTDKLKDAVSGHGSSTGQGQAGTGGQGGVGGATGASSGAGGAGGAQGQDYGDKALNFAEQRTGHQMNADTNERVTDGARGVYEKATGQHVNPKISN